MIIVFDSGIGGFSILLSMLREKVGDSILYLGDQANFPYGEKSQEWLVDRLSAIARWSQNLSPDGFVIACNTGTVAGIEEVRNVLQCPVIGVEPVIKPLGHYQHALVLATPTTAQSLRTRQLLDQYGPHIQVYAAEGLAAAIENNNLEHMKKSLDQISEIVKREKIVAIGLSCTHYPLIIDQIQSRFPYLKIYDPSLAVVNQIKKLTSTSSTAKLRFQTTGAVVRFNQQIKNYFGEGYSAEQVVI